MRHTVLAAALAVVLAALVADPASARPALTHQVNVTLANGSCVLQYRSVSKRNTKILFHVINNGSGPEGFNIWGVRSGMIQPHQEGRFYVQFRGPGHYAYACLSRNGAFKKGRFTIRKS